MSNENRIKNVKLKMKNEGVCIRGLKYSHKDN